MRKNAAAVSITGIKKVRRMRIPPAFIVAFCGGITMGCSGEELTMILKARTSAAALAMLFAGVAHAQTLEGGARVKALQKGGYVIVMRHTSSPREVPDAKAANADNVKPERQLDEVGRSTATAMGKALRDLKIPIGEVFTSPTYRALETVKYAQLGTPKPVAELGENGQSMQGGTEAQAVWRSEEHTSELQSL